MDSAEIRTRFLKFFAALVGTIEFAALAWPGIE